MGRQWWGPRDPVDPVSHSGRATEALHLATSYRSAAMPRGGPVLLPRRRLWPMAPGTRQIPAANVSHGPATAPSRHILSPGPSNSGCPSSTDCHKPFCRTIGSMPPQELPRLVPQVGVRQVNPMFDGPETDGALPLARTARSRRPAIARAVVVSRASSRWAIDHFHMLT